MGRAGATSDAQSPVGRASLRHVADAPWRGRHHGKVAPAHLALGTWRDGELVIAPFDPAAEWGDGPDHRPRVSADYEAAIKALFPAGMPAEEYAGRYGASYLAFTLDDYRYPDAAFDAWVQRLGLILRNPSLLAHYRAAYAGGAGD